MESKVTLKLFIGCQLSGEAKFNLRESLAWKQSKIGTTAPTLIETHHQNREYIGNFLEEAPLTLSQLRSQEKFILETLASFCPKLNLSHCKMMVFPQILVS
jgi:hypothetical protein